MMTHQDSLLNYLVREGYLTASQLVKATQIQAQQGGELLQVLVMMDFISRDKLRLAQHLHQQWQRSLFQNNSPQPNAHRTGSLPVYGPPRTPNPAQGTGAYPPPSYETPMFASQMQGNGRPAPPPALPPDSSMNAIPTPHYIELSPVAPPEPLTPAPQSMSGYSMPVSHLPPPTEIEPSTNQLLLAQPVSPQYQPYDNDDSNHWHLTASLPQSVEEPPVPQPIMPPHPAPVPAPSPQPPPTPAPLPESSSNAISDAMKTLAMEPQQFLPELVGSGEPPWWMEEENSQEIPPEPPVTPAPYNSTPPEASQPHRDVSDSQDSLLQQYINHRFYVQEKLATHSGYSLYLAHDQSTGQPVIVRQMPFFSFVTNQHVFRFKKEAEQLLALKHPNVVQTLAYGVNPAWGAYLVHEYLEGPTLRDHMLRRPTYNLHEILALFQALCPVLDLFHQRGFPHRNLNLSSLQWLDHSSQDLNQLKLLPMGTSPLAFAELTVPWMLARHATFPLNPCPELLRGMAHELTPRADIYALGNLLFELLVGKSLFTGDTLLHLLQQHAFAYPQSLDVATPDILYPLKVQVLVHHSLLKSPGQRPPSPMLWLQALEQAIQQAPSPLAAEEPFNAFDPWDNSVFQAANQMLAQNQYPPLEQQPTLIRLLHRLAEKLRSPRRQKPSSPSAVHQSHSNHLLTPTGSAPWGGS